MLEPSMSAGALHHSVHTVNASTKSLEFLADLGAVCTCVRRTYHLLRRRR